MFSSGGHGERPIVYGRVGLIDTGTMTATLPGTVAIRRLHSMHPALWSI